jgi:ketosteroid isomerase-like protein
MGAVALATRTPERDTGRAMSQENVEIVRRGFEAWEAGDLSVLLALLDNDLVTRRLASKAVAGNGTPAA